jgi:hypothetical protein
MAFSIPNTFAAGEVIDSTRVNANNTAIAAKLNGQIGGSELNAGDPVPLAKLAASYEVALATLRFSPVAGGWAGAAAPGLLHDQVGVPALSGTDAAWVVTGAEWCCGDCGTGAGTFYVAWIEYAALGVITNVANVYGTAAAPITIALQGGAANDTGNHVISNALNVTLALDAARPRALALFGITANATTATANSFTVTCRLKRQIIA